MFVYYKSLTEEKKMLLRLYIFADEGEAEVPGFLWGMLVRDYSRLFQT